MNKDTHKYHYIRDCRNIYNSLGDDESKYIFEERLLYSLTGDVTHIYNVVKTTEEGRTFLREIENGDDMYIFGAGIWGKEILKVFPDRWKGFIDNSSSQWGKPIGDVTIFSPQKIINNNFSGKVVISSRLYYTEIHQQLLNMGLPESQIINFGKTIDALASKQYFSLKTIPHAEGEVFADIGSLDAKTALEFITWSEDFEKVYCFEPDKKNIPKCQKNLAPYIQSSNAEVIEKGAWSSCGTLNFTSDGNGGSRISIEGESVAVTTIDTIFENKKVTFIKMDIEGSELEALHGAKQVITTQKPKLAVCIYHRPEDIISIAHKLLEYNPDYRFYLRHYSLVAAETVLYAI